VSIQEVRYRYHNSPLKSLWIYGSEQRIYAPGSPWPWGKLAAIVLGCALLYRRRSGTALSLLEVCSMPGPTLNVTRLIVGSQDEQTTSAGWHAS
jgi:hypothetical protein